MTKTVTLGEICDQIRGVSYSGDEAIDIPSEGYLPIFRANNISNDGNLIHRNLVYVPEKRIKSSQLIRKGDIVIAASSGSKEIVGKAAISHEDWHGSFGAFCKVIRAKSVLPDYLGHFFQTSYYRRNISESVEGANINNIRNENIDSLEIPLPSLPEQRRIATLLDKADALRQKDRQLLAHYDQLAQSVFLDLFGDPVKNEKGWKFVSLRGLSSFITDGPFGSNLKTEHYRPTGVRVIRLTNVGIGMFLEKDEAFISEEHYEKVLKKHTCLPGDLVIATLGEPNLRACLVPDNVGKAINKADVILCRPNPKIANSRYLSGLINHPSMLSLASNLLHGQTRVRISMGQLAALEIPLPPIPLQTHFANVIEQIERQKAVVRQQMTASEALFRRLLQESFG